VLGCFMVCVLVIWWCLVKDWVWCVFVVWVLVMLFNTLASCCLSFTLDSRCGSYVDAFVWMHLLFKRL